MIYSSYPEDIQDMIRSVESPEISDEDKLHILDLLEKYSDNDNPDTNILGFVKAQRGIIYYNVNEIARFYENVYEINTMLSRNGNYELIVTVDNMLGILTVARGMAPLAVNYYADAMNVSLQHRTAELEWTVHYSLGNLYMSVDSVEDAEKEFNKAEEIVKSFPDTYSKVYRALILISMGKLYLSSDELGKAENVFEDLNERYIKELSGSELISAEIFNVRYYFRINKFPEMEKRMPLILNLIKKKFVVLDIYDEVLEYLDVLLDAGYFNEFMELWSYAEPIIRKTSVWNIEKNLYELLIRYYKNLNDEEGVKEAAVNFEETNYKMRNETRYLINQMTLLNNKIQILQESNAQIKNDNRLLERQKDTDQLTGLYNRYKMNDYWDRAFENAYHVRKNIAIEILDVDYFKEFNDNYGHAAGDNCLIEISNSITELCREHNLFAARYGGDEFIIIYENRTIEEVDMMSRQLREIVYDKNLKHDFSQVSDRVTISQGICSDIPRGTVKSFDFFNTADHMLYSVKNNGKNGIKIGRCMDFRKNE